MSHHLHLLAMLLIAHALCDYPLQGDFLARAKNHAKPLPGVPWHHAMAAHCAIHAGAVWYLTGSDVLALFEFGAHWLIDYLKCGDWFDFAADQWMHAACKAGYVGLLFAFGGR